jgi:hypothetical protein
MYRHRRTLDFNGLDKKQRRTLQVALEKSDHDFGAVDGRIPVSSSDLGRFIPILEDRADTPVHVVEADRFGIPRSGYVTSRRGERGEVLPASVRWEPNEGAPAGAIELDHGVFDRADTAREVFMAEAVRAATRALG